MSLNSLPQCRSAGFSLTELMVGVGIMAILFALALPSYRTMLLNTQIRNAAESVQNGLQRARSEAVGGNTFASFVLRPVAPNDAVSWDVTVVGKPGFVDSRLSNEGSRDVIRATQPPGATTVTFDNTGRPTAGSMTQVDFSLPAALLPAAQSKPLNVKINFGGTIRMCDPHVVTPDPRAC